MSPQSPAIRVSHISKQYKLGGPQEPYHTLRDAIVNSLKAPMKALHKAPPAEGFWALKDMSFEVEPGEVVGIIGRNGAGKSTLLKILSRITSPTEGTVELHGRVGSLLEVGTGFHPELTGRENIYLSGSILGMKRRDIDDKLDDIVKFSEIEQFLDTPVKRYSSGMYVRLAFAVAAHLEPEILLVDEVLAVGDAGFQKKCLGKMGEVAKEGRTVLFVSHNMGAISNLCSRTILLNNGKLMAFGKTDRMIEQYLHLSASDEQMSLKDRSDRTGDGRFQFIDTWIENERGEKQVSVLSGDNIKIVVIYQIKDELPVSNVSVAFALSNVFFQLTDLGNEMSGFVFPLSIPKKGRIECLLQKLPLNYGTYYYNLIARSNNGVEDWVQKAGSFSVEAGDYYGTGKTVSPEQGSFLFDQKWNLIALDS